MVPPIGADGFTPTLEQWQDGVNRLDSAAFGRAPDQQGRDDWANLASGGPIDFEAMVNYFLQSPEGVQRSVLDASNVEFCKVLYE